jgi:D-threo-aldose 1-dehydrogenase
MQLGDLGMGCSALGNLYRSMSDGEAHAAVTSALAGGIRYFDVAPLYGFGLAEKRLGKALASDPDVVISTKVGRVLRPTIASGARDGFVDALAFEPVFDYSFAGVVSSYEASLSRLRHSRVKILLAHDLGAQTHGSRSAQMTKTFLEGGYQAMRQLQAAGEIDAIGIGVNETAVCEELLDAVDLDVILLAGRYTLLEQGALPLLDRCAHLGVQVIIGGPFNSGLLVETDALHYNYQAPPQHIVARVHALRAICAQFGVPLPAAALQFPTAHPAVSCVLPGLASTPQVEQTLRWREQRIPAELWEALREAGLLDAGAPVPHGSV